MRFRLWVDAATEAAAAEHRARAWAVWHGEALARMKKLPALDKFLGVEKRKQSPAEIKARLIQMAGGPKE